MLSKTVNSISRTTTGMIHTGVDLVRGLTLAETRDLFRFAWRRLSAERLPQVAGSLTFTTVLALVPLLTIAFALFTTFPIFSNFRAALDAYFVQTVIPKGIANTIASNLANFASKATRLSAVGAVALVITSAAMLGMIERAFNQIWNVRRPRPLGQRLMVYWALVTVGPLTIGLSLAATSELYMATSGLVKQVPLVGAFFYTIVSVGLTTGFYALLFAMVPNRRVNWRDAVWGGLVAAIAFEVAKRLFGAFVRQFPTWAIIYGALAALPVFLMWVYISWLITLFGAVLTAALPVIKYERWWHQPAPGAEFVDAMAILKVLHVAAHSGDTALVSTATIRAHTRIGYDEMTMLLEQMEALGWVGRVQHEPPRRVQWGKRVREDAENWVLLINPEKIRVADVYRLFVFRDAAVGQDLGGESPLSLDTARLAREVEQAVEEGLQATLAEKFRS
jgi:membrane protein